MNWLGLAVIGSALIQYSVEGKSDKQSDGKEDLGVVRDMSREAI